MGTAIVSVLLIMIIGAVIRSMYRDRKAGKSLHCGHDCKHCKRHCH